MQTLNTDRRKSRWLPFSMLGLVIVLAAGWTAIWFKAESIANERFDFFLERQDARGNQWICEDRQSGGYPFRLHIRCAGVNGQITHPDGDHYEVVAGSFMVVGRAYALGHVIAELDGPIRINRIGSRLAEIEADWSSLRASIIGTPGNVDALDVVIDNLSGQAPGLATAPGADNRFTADHVEAHARVLDRTGDKGDIALAAQSRALRFSPTGEETAPVDADLLATAMNAPLGGTADPVATFAANGGLLQIDNLKLKQSGSVMKLKGQLRLDAQMRPQGAIELAATGDDLRTPGVTGAFGGILPIVAMALRFTGKPTDIDGQPASGATLTVENGDVRLGAMVIGQVPPLR